MASPDIAQLDDIPSASVAVDAYVHGALPAGLPTVVTDALTGFYPSAVAKVATVAEALYACVDQLDQPGQVLIVQLAQFCMINGFYLIGQTPRGTGIVQAVRRRLGDTTVTQPADQDPAPDSTYLPAPPPPQPPPGPPLS